MNYCQCSAWVKRTSKTREVNGVEICKNCEKPYAGDSTTPYSGEKLQGNNGSVTFDGTWVTIERAVDALTVLNQGLAGTKRIPVSNILSVQFREPGLTVGYIQFATAAGESRKASGGLLRGALSQAVQDENSVLFGQESLGKFNGLRVAVENAISAKGAGSISQTVTSGESRLNQLTSLAELFEKGFLTKDEFEVEKKKLLSTGD